MPAIARLVTANEDTCSGRDSPQSKGLAALDPQWAGGRAILISDGDIEVIVADATTQPVKLSQPFTRWSSPSSSWATAPPT